MNRTLGNSLLQGEIYYITVVTTCVRAHVYKTNNLKSIVKET